MWTDGAAITKQLSDADVERAANGTKRRSFLDDLDPDARERLEEIRGQIDRGEIAFRRSPRGGRPATDGERAYRRDPMRRKTQDHSKADLIVDALRERPNETQAEIAADLGVSRSYLKQIARAEGIYRTRGRKARPTPVEKPKPKSKPKPKPRPIVEGPTRDDRRYYAWGLLQTATRASYTTIAQAAGLPVDTVRLLDPGRLVRGRKPKAAAVVKRGRQERQPRQPRVVAPVAPSRPLSLATREGIVEMAGSGLTVEEIAAQLGVFEATVRFHIRVADRSRAAKVQPWITFVEARYRVVCGCSDPWGAHPSGFRWETNGGDLRHWCEREAE